MANITVKFPQDYGGLVFTAAFGKIIFILFIFFIMLVIMNLLNGLAVSDIGEWGDFFEKFANNLFELMAVPVLFYIP